MKNVSTKRIGTYLQNAKIPWVTFLFLAAVFFVTVHNLFLFEDFSIDPTLEVSVRNIIEGSLKRRIAFLSLGLFGVISIMRRGWDYFKINGFLGWLILFYIVWAFSSLVWAEDITLTFRRLVLFVMFLLGALAVAQRFSLRDIIWFAFFSTSLYLIIGIIAEIAIGTFLPFEPGYRFAGTIHPNFQGLNCSVLLLATVFLSRGVKRYRKFIIAISLVALIFLILTKSRTAFASAVLALVAYWALVASIKRKLALILGVSLTFCLLLLLVGNEFFPAMRQGVLLGREDPTTYTLTGRIPLWSECLKYVSKRPFIGYGYGSFWTPRNVSDISVSLGWVVGGGHSVYLELLLNLGCIGMVTFVLIYVVGIRRSFVSYRASLNKNYAFFWVLLIFCVLDGILESMILYPDLLTFLSMVSLAKLAFIIPEHIKMRVKT